MPDMREKLIEMALQAGADNAAALDAGDIALSADFRALCRANACGLYGRCWMCPPDAGDIDMLMDRVRAYSKAVLYQTIRRLEDSFDIEGMAAAAKAHALVSRKLLSETRRLWAGDMLHLSCGGCRYCETCAKVDGMPCRHPQWALPSLESHGVDVYATATRAGLRYVNGQNTVTYFGMALWRD